MAVVVLDASAVLVGTKTWRVGVFVLWWHDHTKRWSEFLMINGVNRAVLTNAV